MTKGDKVKCYDNSWSLKVMPSGKLESTCDLAGTWNTEGVKSIEIVAVDCNLPIAETFCTDAKNDTIVRDTKTGTIYFTSSMFLKIVPEYVDFAEAWKAYEKRRVIQAAQTGNKKRKSLGIVQKFDEFEIRNKWLILEDE